MATWRINVDDWRGGLAPGYYETEYPSFGKFSYAGKAQGIDLTDPSYLKQGVGREELTGSVTGDVRMLDEPVDENVTYGVAEDKVYRITDTEVTEIHTLPSGATASDVAYYDQYLYVSYNNSSTGALARYDIDGDSWNNTWREDLEPDVPHRMVVGGLNFLYIGNKNKIASYDSLTDTWANDDLILPQDQIIVSMQFTKQYLQILTNTPSVNKGARSSIFVWNTIDPSWDIEYKFRERLTNNIVHNGITYIHYDDQGKSRLGILDGSDIRPARAFGGESPYWYQVTIYQGFVAWIADNNVFLWGAPEAFLEPTMFPISSDDVKTISAPFGKLVFGKTGKLSIQKDYQPEGYWKGVLVNISGNDKYGVVDALRVGFNQLPEGKHFTVKLVDSTGKVIFQREISGEGEVRHYQSLSIKNTDIRPEIHFDGNTEDTVEIRDIFIKGHTSI